jgi:Acetyltransferase (GNAT) family
VQLRARIKCRRGVGSALTQRLAQRARANGIRRFRALTLAHNQPALKLTGELGTASFVRDGHAVEVESRSAHIRGAIGPRETEVANAEVLEPNYATARKWTTPSGRDRRARCRRRGSDPGRL